MSFRQERIAKLSVVAGTVCASLFFLVMCKKAEKTTLFVVPSIHALHAENELYNYDSLRVAIARFEPDVVAVEIRPEDIGGSTEYLSRYYAVEMCDAAKIWFADADVVGIDWRGAEIEGKPIPHGYWKSQPVSERQRVMAQTEKYGEWFKRGRQLRTDKKEVLRNASLDDLRNGVGREYVLAFYGNMYDMLAGTEFGDISEYYAARDEHMWSNIENVLKNNNGKRIAILIGYDHYEMTRNKLAKLTERGDIIVTGFDD